MRRLLFLRHLQFPRRLEQHKRRPARSPKCSSGQEEEHWAEGQEPAKQAFLVARLWSIRHRQALLLLIAAHLLPRTRFSRPGLPLRGWTTKMAGTTFLHKAPSAQNCQSRRLTMSPCTSQVLGCASLCSRPRRPRPLRWRQRRRSQGPPPPAYLQGPSAWHSRPLPVLGLHPQRQRRHDLRPLGWTMRRIYQTWNLLEGHQQNQECPLPNHRQWGHDRYPGGLRILPALLNLPLERQCPPRRCRLRCRGLTMISAGIQSTLTCPRPRNSSGRLCPRSERHRHG